MRKTFTKYLILFTIYFIISRVIYSFGFKVYYNLVHEPEITSVLVYKVQMYLTFITFLTGLVIAVFMFFDFKDRKLLEWLIIILSIFYPAAGISFFLIRQFLTTSDNTWHNKVYKT